MFPQHCQEVGHLGLVRRCWGPGNGIHPDVLCRHNQPVFQGRGARYPCLGQLHVEAWLLGNFSTKLVSWASGNWTFHAKVPISGTHTLNLSTNSKAGSGAGDRHRQYADVSLVFHPATSESIPVRTLAVMWTPEWQQNRTVHAVIDEGSLLDSGGAGLGNNDVNVVMEEQITIPDGAVIFSAGKVSAMTTIVILLTVSVALAEENTSLISPDGSEIGLLGTFHLVSNPDAVPSSSNGQVAWARQASINVCGQHLKEPLEDFFDYQFRLLEWC